MKLSEVLSGIGRPVAYFPRLAEFLGSVKAAIFLSQLVYWADKTINGGWVYKTAKELSQETGLSRKEQVLARRSLCARGIISQEYRRFKHKLYFRVETKKLDEQWEAAYPRMCPKRKENTQENTIIESREIARQPLESFECAARSRKLKPIRQEKKLSSVFQIWQHYRLGIRADERWTNAVLPATLTGRNAGMIKNLLKSYEGTVTDPVTHICQMIDCLILDWYAVREKYRFADDVPSVIHLVWKSGELSAAISTGSGITHGGHRVSVWSQRAQDRGEIKSEAERIGWK